MAASSSPAPARATRRPIPAPLGTTSVQTRRRLARLGVYVALIFVVAQTVYPLLWVLFGSLKSSSELFNNVWGPPSSIELRNYSEAWEIAQLGSRALNSVLVTGLALGLIVVVATPCAYAIARMRFPGRRLLLGVIVAAMLVPPQVMAIPLFVVARDLGMINSRTGIAVIYAATGLSLSIFILRGFFLALPGELEDAARVDGAGRLVVLVRIMLPLVRPGLAFVVIVQFIEIWNEFFLAFMFLRKPGLQTIPLGLVNFFQQYSSQWTLYFAALMITTLPVILVFVLMQRQFIAGLTAGAVKG